MARVVESLGQVQQNQQRQSKSSAFLIRNLLSLSPENTNVNICNNDNNGDAKQHQWQPQPPSKADIQSYQQASQATCRSLEQVVIDLRLAKLREHQLYPQLDKLIQHQNVEAICSCEPKLQAGRNSTRLKRRTRTSFSDWQLASLEWRFARNKYLTTSDRIKVAKMLKLDQLHVKTWFQVSRS